MALLEYEDLSIELPGMARPVLDHVGLTVSAGEVVALVGESGSGKSVTARAALGLFPAGAGIEGQVRVDGTGLVFVSHDLASSGTYATRRSSCTGGGPWNTGPSRTCWRHPDIPIPGCCWHPFPGRAGTPIRSAADAGSSIP